MAIVEQDPGLIYDDLTISDNIKFGDVSQLFSEEDVIHAATAAKVHDDIIRLRNVRSFHSHALRFVIRDKMYTSRHHLYVSKLVEPKNFICLIIIFIWRDIKQK